jgi:2-phospho-L-lactate guanylyltransferase (CobY/MobA/RfbA family)
MRLTSLFKDLEYVGEAEGDRLSYAVFRGPDAYLVVAPNSRGGLNVNVVKRETPEAIRKRFHGKRVTTTTVSKASRRLDRFALLNSLYVMVALKWAKKLKEREGRSMIFKIA